MTSNTGNPILTLIPVDDLPTRELWEATVDAIFKRIDEDLAEEQPGTPSVAFPGRLLSRLARLPVPVGWVDETVPGPKPIPKPVLNECVFGVFSAAHRVPSLLRLPRGLTARW